MRLFVSLLLCLASAAVADEAAMASLQQQLAGIQGLRGNFQQQLVSSEGVELEQSSGNFRLLQPDYFAWEIRAPDEQLLLAAEGSLWHHDVELETVTRRNISPDNPYSPLTILGGDRARLQQHYRVERIGKQAWRLLPIFADPDFSAIALTFDGNVPAMMEIFDPLERRTVIRFANVQLNPPLGPADFHFEPPPGVDIYDHER